MLPVAPVPKARPKVSKWGTYYPTTTKNWMYDAAASMASITAGEPTRGGLYILVTCVCTRPKNPANPYPRGDVDNYVKGIMDAITKEQIIWADDKQVVDCHIHKRYADEDETPHTYVEVAFYDDDLNRDHRYFTPAISQDVLDQPDTISIEEM